MSIGDLSLVRYTSRIRFFPPVSVLYKHGHLILSTFLINRYDSHFLYPFEEEEEMFDLWITFRYSMKGTVQKEGRTVSVVTVVTVFFSDLYQSFFNQRRLRCLAGYPYNFYKPISEWPTLKFFPWTQHETSTHGWHNLVGNGRRIISLNLNRLRSNFDSVLSVWDECYDYQLVQ